MPFIPAGHIWLIGLLLVGVLIVRGPGKLPEVGAGLGRAMREFHKVRSDVVDSVVRPSSEPTEPGRPGEESTAPEIDQCSAW